jgi:hypothetical protein
MTFAQAKSFADTKYLCSILVSNRGVGCCLEPEGNGVNSVGGDEGGPVPPSGEQDKQLTASREGDNILMEWEEDGRKGQA